MSEQLDGWYLLNDIPGEGGDRDREETETVPSPGLCSVLCKYLPSLQYCVSTLPPLQCHYNPSKITFKHTTYYWLT